MKWPEHAVRKQLLVKKVWFTAGSLQGSLTKKSWITIRNAATSLIFHSASSSQQLSAYVCLEEAVLPADRGYRASSPEGKGKQEGKKAILHQTMQSQSTSWDPRQTFLGKPYGGWGWERLWSERRLLAVSEWMGWLKKLSGLTPTRAEKQCQDNHLRHNQALSLKTQWMASMKSQLTRQNIEAYSCVHDMLIHGRKCLPCCAL